MEENLRRTTRIRKLPSTLDIYHHNAKSYAVTCKNNKVKYPISEFLGYNKFSENYRNYSIHLALTHEPETYEEAIIEPHWRKAIKDELTALADNKTSSIVKRTQNIKPIGCKYVFKTKLNSEGKIDKYKARLVAKGFCIIKSKLLCVPFSY